MHESSPSREQWGASDYIGSAVADFAQSLFVGRFRLRCDNEPVVLAVAEKVKEKFPESVLLETTPHHSSASTGLAERAVRAIGEQVRTLRYDAQDRYKTLITPSSPVWPWLVRHAGFNITRYSHRAGGATPFRAT